VRQNPHTIYYNAQIAGKNCVDEFFKDVCTQLSLLLDNLSRTSSQPSPQATIEVVNANEGSWLFSNLLQQISDKLPPDEKLIIIIDALDAVDINSQAVGTNLFYLPRYLPNQVYFIFARRPYQKSHSGLLIEAPSQILDLSDYPVENREDIKKYIRNKLTTETQSSQRNIIELINEDEDNFMYVQQVLKAMADGFYSANDVDQIPPDLETYYQQHWQKMQGEGLSDVAVDVLRVLTAAETQAMSTVAISKITNVDVYDVAEIIESWLEFLQETRIGKEIRYTLYHNSFRLWLASEKLADID
jgi:hypothetical protein